jgi:putative sterol carrier protein
VQAIYEPMTGARAEKHLVAITMAVFWPFIAGAFAYENANATPQEVFDGMRESFRAEKAKGVYARYQFELSGPNGGEWWIDVRDGKFRMGKGKIENPSVVFMASDKDWVALSDGKLAGFWAYLTGRLKIRGDQALSRKLDEIFN